MNLRTTALPILLTLLTSPSAHAGDTIAAEALFRDGRALMDQGNYAAACPKLAESFAQDPATGTLLALAVCQEGAGQTASAWATFADAAGRAKQDGRADREQAARDAAAALEPKLSWLTVKLSDAVAATPGLVVRRDGKDVSRGLLGTSVPVDPGEHVLTAEAPGKRPWSSTVKIGPVADRQEVVVPALEDEGAPLAAAPAAASPGSAEVGSEDAAADASSDDGGGAPLRTIGIIVGGVGIIGLGLGTYFGLSAGSLNDESNADGHCDEQNTCDATGGAKRDDAMAAADIATVALIAGGVLTAAGVTLFIVGGADDTSSAHVQAVPVVGANEAAMLVRGSF